MHPDDKVSQRSRFPDFKGTSWRLLNPYHYRPRRHSSAVRPYNCSLINLESCQLLKETRDGRRTPARSPPRCYYLSRVRKQTLCDCVLDNKTQKMQREAFVNYFMALTRCNMSLSYYYSRLKKNKNAHKNMKPSFTPMTHKSPQN